MIELLLLLVGMMILVWLFQGFIKLNCRLIDYHSAHPTSSCLLWLLGMTASVAFSVWAAIG